MTKSKSIMSEDTKQLTAKKDENFSEWYTQLIQKSNLADYSKVSGCMILKPAAYSIWEKIKCQVDKRIKKLGVKNAYFPLFIPESLLMKEQKHVEGFAPEVAWITEAGDTKLNERLAVRPTSEAIMYDSYSKWIRSWRDLPLKLNQWNNVVRWEFKHPVPFLRTREFLWNEGHTAFATKKEAHKEGRHIVRMYKEIMENYLALPVIIGKKSGKEKFAGAEYTISLETVLPNKRAIQGPDFHHDGQNFAKAYEIKYQDENGKEEYVWQNTWAITTRMIGVMVAVHSDNKGLVIPPKLAENKIVIIPILIKGKEKAVLEKAEQLQKQLRKFRPILDKREDYSPGWKYSEWEMKGIPLRIEIGPKDLETNSITLVRRDTGNKSQVKLTELKKELKAALRDMQNNLYGKAEKELAESLAEADNYEDFRKEIENRKLVLAPHCGKPECEDIIKSEFEGVKTLNSPLKNNKTTKPCIKCGKKSKYKIYFGRSY